MGAGIAQAPELAVVRVDLPAWERVLVCDIDEAAAGGVANPDLDGPPRNVLGKKGGRISIFQVDLRFEPETSAPKEHFEPLFSSGTSDPAKR